MKELPPSIQLRQIHHFLKADADYGRRVAQGLSIDIEEAIHKAA